MAKIQYNIGKLYWLLKKPVTVGVKVVVRAEDDAVLLVRQAYQSYWSLPGGGVEAGESSRSAAIREVKEETGIAIDDEEVSLFSVYFSKGEYKSDHILLFSARAKKNQRVHSDSEIEDVGWFQHDQLPEGTSSATRRRIDEVINGRKPPEFWLSD